MANLSNLIKVTQAQYLTLLNGGTITKGGVSYTYDPYAFYVVEDDTGKKYLHNIQITYSNTHIATFSLINTRSTSYGNGSNTDWPYLVGALNSAGFSNANNACPATGQFYLSGQTNLVTGVYYASSGVMGFKGIIVASTSSSTMTVNINTSTTTSTLGASATIYDVVQEL